MKRFLVTSALACAAHAYGFGQMPACAASAHAPATLQDRTRGDGPAAPPVRIERLQVRVVTSRKRGSGTDNAVYFDIGPLAWRLNKPFHDDFEGGASDTYELPLPDGVELTTDDILWLRLQKKGLFGVLGTRDGLTGAWLPEKIQLIVNGIERPELGFEVGRSLNSRRWVWKAEVRRFGPGGDGQRFVRSLRMRRNGKLTWLAQPQPDECARRPQHGGCSAPLPLTCASGVVLQSDKSTDGLATIDLKVEKIEFCPRGVADCDPPFALDEKNGYKSPRFLRVEYRHRKNHVPEKGAAVRACGRVFWDTDREGWYEIHPRNAADLTPPG